MCGIVGIFDSRGLAPVDRELLSRMNRAQQHRGPDGAGLHVEPGVGLGHQRLAIIDLTTGAQPLYNEDDSVVVVFNGEIYNYQPLMRDLAALGHRFHTRSDTEVIVHAWEQWGEACVERFRGMFAFALWDRNRETLFLARDRLGVKPLHYAWLADGTLIFGSELKSLLAHPALPRVVDPYAIEEYFALGYIVDPRTIFAAARKLPAAHHLVVRRGAPPRDPVRFWEPRFTADLAIEPDAAIAELTERLDESVRLRMIADVPLGAFLSGGVDSSAVVASMARASSGPVNTCSIGFADPAFDESAFAATVARRYGTNHYMREVEVDDFDLIDRLSRIYDEPFADSSAIPTFRVCELARQQVTVALSGDGGDENFGGYRRYRLHLSEERLRRALPQSVRGPLFGALAQAYPKADWAPRFLRAKSTFEALGRDAVAAYFHGVSVVREPERRRLFSAGFKAELAGYSALQLFRDLAARAQTREPLGLVQYLDLATYLVGDINTKVDRASMASSLEVREPLMDHVLVEWLARLPASLKVREGEGKWLLKKAMEPRLPHDVLYRRKMGFAVPLARWFRGPLAERVTRTIGGERLLSTGFFDQAGLSRLAEEHRSGARDHSPALWSIVMFDAFLRNVLDVSRPQAQGKAA